MHPIKYLWAARAVVYKMTFGRVGNMTYIGRPTFIEGRKNIYIGNRVRVFPGIRVEAIGNGTIKIGDNTAIEQNVHIISGERILNIGDGTTISANVFISNVDHEYKDIDKSVMEQPLQFKETQIGKSCFIGYGAVILPGTRLGNHCIVGANAVVRGSYPDNCVIAGNPARIIKEYDLETELWKNS
mgnify:CR=1 FL=1